MNHFLTYHIPICLMVKIYLSRNLFKHFELNTEVFTDNVMVTPQRKISCKCSHVLCTERALNMSPFLQETRKTCKNCARNITFLAQFLESSKNLIRNLQGARILNRKCHFPCSVSRILQNIFPWVISGIICRLCNSLG